MSMKMHYLPKLISLLLIAPFSAYAAALAPGSQLITFANNILKTAQVLVTLAFVVALLTFAWGIIRFLIGAGDPGSSKSFLLWGVIAMAVLASLMGLITFLQQAFGIDNGTGTIESPGIVGPNITQPQ